MNRQSNRAARAPLPNPGRPVPGRPTVRRPVLVGDGPPGPITRERVEGDQYVDLTNHVFYVAYRSGGPGGTLEWIRASCTPTATGGPIETISVNGRNVPPDGSKNVDIEVPVRAKDLVQDGLDGVRGTTSFETILNMLGAAVEIPVGSLRTLASLTPLTQVVTDGFLDSVLSGFVRNTVTVNGHPLTGNVTIGIEDIGDFYSDVEIDAKLRTKVGVTRTVNGKDLSTDITLVASDFDDIYSKSDVDGLIEALTSDVSWMPKASGSAFGVVKPDGVTITSTGGVLSSVVSYTLPIATSTSLGGVIIAPSAGLSIDSLGNLSVVGDLLGLPAAVDAVEDAVDAMSDRVTSASVKASAAIARSSDSLLRVGVDTMSADVTFSAGTYPSQWTLSDSGGGVVYHDGTGWVLVRGDESYEAGGLSSDTRVVFEVGRSTVVATRSLAVRYGGFTATGKARFDSRGLAVQLPGTSLFSFIEAGSSVRVGRFLLPAPESSDGADTVVLASEESAVRLAKAAVKQGLYEVLESIDPDTSSLADVITALKNFASEV